MHRLPGSSDVRPDAVDAYLELAVGRYTPLVRELDRIIVAARPDLQALSATAC